MSYTPGQARTWLAFAGFAAIGAFLLSVEHRAHLFGALPFVFLLLCPLLHVFGHGGHASHAGGSNDEPDDDPRAHVHHPGAHRRDGPRARR